MRVKKIFWIIMIFFIIIIMLSNKVLALTELQMRAADLNWDGVVDQEDLKLLVDLGYPDRPEDGIESPNGNYLDLKGTDSQSGTYSGTSIGLAFTQLHENGAMWIFCYGNEASCKSSIARSYLNNYRSTYYIYDYIDEAKEYYYPRGDGTSNGSLNYGYGVLVKMQGQYYNVETYSKYGVDIKSEVDSLSNVSVEITDNVSRDEWLNKREEVIATIESCGYSESDFESYQIDCLTDFRYQGFYASPVIKAYMENGKQCNEAVRNSSGGFGSTYGSRGDDRWTLFSQGIYQWSSSGTVHYVLNPDDFSSSFGGGITNQAEADALTEQYNQMLHTTVHTQSSAGRSGPYQLGPWPSYWDTGLQPFQCTWWANGRANMYLAQHGTKYKRYPTAMGHGGQYYSVNIEGGWFNYGSTPKVNSIISWSGGSYGHVAFVEGVTEEGVWISDAGSGVTWRGVRLISHAYAATSNGYIYLDEPR